MEKKEAPVNVHPEKEQLYKEIDKNRPYQTKEDGLLTTEALEKLRYIYYKHAYARFCPIKDALRLERLGYFQ